MSISSTDTHYIILDNNRRYSFLKKKTKEEAINFYNYIAEFFVKKDFMSKQKWKKYINEIYK